jgi:TRAP-type C4-dicarboxylate transport system permease small subunit
MKTVHTITLPHVSPRRIAGALDTALGHLVEIPAALLVLAEIVVLLAGVTCRYLLRAPLVWSDELASMLFLWLAMLVPSPQCYFRR